jgi:4-hydroxyacetophenone monooxygenase
VHPHDGPSLDTADLGVLRDAVTIANIPTLIPVLVQLTGDQRWLDERFRPRPGVGTDDNDDGGLPEEVQREIRDAAVDAIAAWLGGRECALPEPSEQVLLRLLSVSMGERIPDEYGPMLRQVFGLQPDEAGRSPELTSPPDVRVAIVGAGAAGIAMAHELGKLGVEYTIFERAESIGGTWWYNRYPGCGVDTPSHLYCFSFYDDYDWPHYFSQRDTLHQYLERVAFDLGIKQHVRLRTEMLSARYRDELQGWELQVRNALGAVETHRADVLISAVGAFNRPSWPRGLEAVAGERARCNSSRRSWDSPRTRTSSSDRLTGFFPSTSCTSGYPTRCGGSSTGCRCTASGIALASSGTTTTSSIARSNGTRSGPIRIDP